MVILPVPQFTAPGYEDRTLNTIQRCQNLYPEQTRDGWVLCTAPGISLLNTVTNNASCRGSFFSADTVQRLYSVHDNKLYRLDSGGGVAATLGTLGTTTGRVFFAENPTQLLVVDGTDGYIVTKSTDAFAAIADSNFTAITPLGASFLDGYFIVADAGTGQFYLSALNDGTDWTPASFATAESRADRIVGHVVANEQLYLIGSESLEVWYNTGAADFALQRITGMAGREGCVDAGSIAEYQGEICYLGNQGVVWRINKGGVAKTSTPQIETTLSVFSSTTSAIYPYSGHLFYQLSDSAHGCYVLDLTNGKWHEEADASNSVPRWRHPVVTSFAAYPWAFDTTNGKVYGLTGGDQAGSNLNRIRDFGPIGDGSHRLFFERIEFGMEITDESGNSAFTASLYWSDTADFSTVSPVTLTGTISGTELRLSYNRLGSSRKRYFRLLYAKKANVVLKYCNLHAHEGRF